MFDRLPAVESTQSWMNFSSQTLSQSTLAHQGSFQNPPNHAEKPHRRTPALWRLDVYTEVNLRLRRTSTPVRISTLCWRSTANLLLQHITNPRYVLRLWLSMPTNSTSLHHGCLEQGLHAGLHTGLHAGLWSNCLFQKAEVNSDISAPDSSSSWGISRRSQVKHKVYTFPHLELELIWFCTKQILVQNVWSA